MVKFSSLPLTEGLIKAHPSLAHRDIGEVMLTSLARMSPVRQHERRQAEAAQRRLDQVLAEKLGSLADIDATRVIQIGAHDGQSDDPLFESLNRRRWSAVLVEPTKLAFNALRNLRGQRPSTTLVNKAVTPTGEAVTLYTPVVAGHEAFGSVWTSTDRSQVEREVKRNLGRHMLRRTEIEEATLEAVSPEGLLVVTGTLPEQVDVLVCDIEGQDPPVVNAFLDAGVYPEVLLFEHFHADPSDSASLGHRLTDEGYEITVSVKDTLAVR